jgi:hypothetical protein
MSEWIATGEEGLSVRTKLNDLHDLVYAISGATLGSTSGTSGTSGTNGTSGRKGSSGVSGTSGSSGFNIDNLTEDYIPFKTGDTFTDSVLRIDPYPGYPEHGSIGVHNLAIFETEDLLLHPTIIGDSSKILVWNESDYAVYYVTGITMGITGFVMTDVYTSVQHRIILSGGTLTVI